MLKMEDEIYLKIETINAIGENNYNRLRDSRPDLSIIEINQLAVAHQRLHTVALGISNAEYRYKTVQSPSYNQYMGRGDRCSQLERSKTIKDYCEQNRYTELAGKKIKFNFWKQIAIEFFKFSLLFATLLVITLLASAL